MDVPEPSDLRRRLAAFGEAASRIFHRKSPPCRSQHGEGAVNGDPFAVVFAGRWTACRWMSAQGWMDDAVIVLTRRRWGCGLRGDVRRGSSGRSAVAVLVDDDDALLDRTTRPPAAAVAQRWRFHNLLPVTGANRPHRKEAPPAACGPP